MDAAEPHEAQAAAGLVNEAYEVWHRRYQEAAAAGLDSVDALRFAESGTDVGELRRLVRRGASPDQIRRILL